MRSEPIPLGGWAVEPAHLALAFAGLCVVLLLALGAAIGLRLVRRARQAEATAANAQALDAELADLKTRVQTLTEVSVSRQSDLARAVNERLDHMSQRVGQNLTETSQKTAESLSKLHERLAVIDSAQKNLTDLSSQMVSLRDILSDKQSRGAFGQGRMEAIVQDALPKDAYAFQATLSNGKRPDCLIRLPNAPGVAIDAKFPLEGFESFRQAQAETERKDAARLVRQDVNRHVDAIAERYLIPGETQDTAIMFVPSEAVYADLHEHFPDLIQKASRTRVVIVSPNMLMLAVQTMQAVLKDVKMREQAGMIQKEVSHLMADVHRLRDRVLKLQQHFGLATKDIEQVLISSDKIAGRGRRIESLDFADTSAAGAAESEAGGGPASNADQRDLPAGE